MNKGQYEIAKERKQQEYYDLDIKQLEHKNSAKRYAVDAEKIKIDVAREGVNAAKISLNQSRTNNSIASEKLSQSKDSLSYEKGMTRINREQLMAQANQAVLNMAQTKTELEESKQLFQLRFGKTAPNANININKSLGG